MAKACSRSTGRARRFFNRAARGCSACPRGGARGAPRPPPGPRAARARDCARGIEGTESPKETWSSTARPPALACVRRRSRGARGAILLVGDVSTIPGLERMRTDFVANVSTSCARRSRDRGRRGDARVGRARGRRRGAALVETISRHADRLKALVDDLLTLSRLESAPETIDRVSWTSRSSCASRARPSVPRAREAGVALEVRPTARCRTRRPRGAAAGSWTTGRQRRGVHAVGRARAPCRSWPGREGVCGRRQRHRLAPEPSSGFRASSAWTRRVAGERRHRARWRSSSTRRPPRRRDLGREADPAPGARSRSRSRSRLPGRNGHVPPRRRTQGVA